MLFCRTKYINSSVDPINYRISEYIMGDVKSNGNNNNMANDINESLPEHNDPEATNKVKLSPIECDNRFSRLPEGIDLALHRTKLWSKYAKDLINYIEKRSNLEAEHARNLSKLAQTMKPILKEESYLPLQSVYLSALDNDLDNSSACLANSSLLVGHKFIEPLAARRAEHEKARKQIKQEWTRELKRTHDALSNLRKARMIYFQRKQEYERLKSISGETGSTVTMATTTTTVTSSDSENVGKIERRRRIEEEACFRAQEAEIFYRNAINEVNERTKCCEEVKKTLLSRIRELIYHCDQTLKTVTIGYFQCQQSLTIPLSAQFTSLTESTRLYEPGSEYTEYINGLPGCSRIMKNNGTNFGDEFKFEIYNDPHGLNSQQERSHSESTIDSGEDGRVASPQEIQLPINSSGKEIDGDVNRESDYESIAKYSTLPKATQSHHFRKLKTPSRCRSCDAYVCFQGLECTNCGLTCHRKCLIELTISCSGSRCLNKTVLPRRMTMTTTFGVDLKNHGDEVPFIVIKCITELDRRGVNIKGLYRINGVKSRVEKICQLFENSSSDNLIDLSDVHPNIIANVLKLYLRQLPEPLITFKLYPDFIAIAKQYPTSSGRDVDDDPKIVSEIISQLRDVTSKLPNIHYQVLSYLCHHLKRISDNYKINNMPSSNLGIVFGPTLLRTGEGISLSSLVDTGHQARVVQLLITYADEIFGCQSKNDEIDGSSVDCRLNRTQVTLQLDGKRSTRIRSFDENASNISNNNNNNNNNFVKSNSLDRHRDNISPTPSIYSSSAVIKLSGQQIITSSSLYPNLPYNDGPEGLRSSPSPSSGRNSLYELRRQFFASPTSSPISSSSTSSASSMPTAVSSSSTELRSLPLMTSSSASSLHNRQHQTQSTTLPSKSGSTLSTTSSSITNNNNNNKAPMTISSWSLSQPNKIRQASIISSGTPSSGSPVKQQTSSSTTTQALSTANKSRLTTS